MLKTPKGQEGLEIFAASAYHRDHAAIIILFWADSQTAILAGVASPHHFQGGSLCFNLIPDKEATVVRFMTAVSTE